MRKVKSHLASGSKDLKAGGQFPVTGERVRLQGGVVVWSDTEQSAKPLEVSV